MATQPSANAGTATYFAVTSAGGANLGTELTGYVRNVEPTYNGQRIDITTMGNTSRRYLTGFLENGYRLSGVWDTTLDGILFPLLTAGSAAPIRYGPAGTATGKARHDSTAVLTAYSPPSDVNDAVTWTAEYAVDGVVSRSTF